MIKKVMFLICQFEQYEMNTSHDTKVTRGFAAPRAKRLHFFYLRTSKILLRLNVLIFLQQFEAQYVLILFLAAICFLMAENKLKGL